MRGGMGRPISKSPMAFPLFICPPIVRSCSRPKLFGHLSTSRSSTSTLQLSRNSTRKSPTNASPLPSSANKSNHAPISIGGQIRSSRINQPETVSDHDENFCCCARPNLLRLRLFGGLRRLRCDEGPRLRGDADCGSGLLFVVRQRPALD